jgi:DNA-binding MarR family transcriptional regulator/GNAT superfamily N-acetyltransferase
VVREVRAFNRTVTQRIGVLQESFLARGRPLGASRLLWEIGGGISDVRELRARLELDSGYVSRLLRSLEAEGLVAVEPDPADRRARRVRLTAEGEEERRLLDQRSDDLAQSLLEPLGESQRERLVEAMGVVERLLTAGLVTVAIEDPESPDARACIDAYFEEISERFEHGFDAGASTLPDANVLREPRGLLLIARLHGGPIGCGGLLFSGAVADIKRMWISKSVRGLGVGRRLLSELESHARERGATETRLETNRSLTEAISLYRSSGYVECEPFNDEVHSQHWFTKPLAPSR